MVNKFLIVYYSLTGNTHLIAESIKEQTGADIERLKPIKDLNSESGTRFFWGGMHAKMKQKPKLEPLQHDPNDYDLIFLGTPVWAWTLTPPIRSYLKLHDLSSQPLAIWNCAAGNGIKAMQRLKKEIPNANIVGENTFTDPLTNDPDGEVKRAKEWAAEIINSLE
ncbi:MAG: flavodoxin [Candidatus Lokiarchaeota archaeon]|nr:flavodoxin [Candidatus Lokiarchaeota archaeon]